MELLKEIYDILKSLRWVVALLVLATSFLIYVNYFMPDVHYVFRLKVTYTNERVEYFTHTVKNDYVSAHSFDPEAGCCYRIRKCGVRSVDILSEQRIEVEK